MRVCTKCHKSKPLEDFHFYNKEKNLRRGECKDCAYKRAKELKELHPEDFATRRRKTLIKHKYGMSVEEYEAMLDSQGGACAICRRVVDYLLHVDHDHHTGAVRGLLCRNCNTGIGYLQDNVETLFSAIKYLEG